MKKVTSSSFHICWDEPVYRGSPYLAGYDISYNDEHERIGAVNCFSFDSDHFEWGQSYNVAISALSAISKGGKSPSRNLTLTMGNYISCAFVCCTLGELSQKKLVTRYI